ncbi:TetR family transcriptional regulator [Paracidovorax citrulli]|nr:TetR family transcriptional regulator [Paracidovorax citrulli]REG70078.1 TetR family transcriptional regulator [Paracidovorax citrulli]RLJ94629.1 TetR family transcriptional regulator [Paracidovorax citrulli]SDJ23947.1 transcriptional regulator, TetR family [Paracidovorax citrulli]
MVRMSPRRPPSRPAPVHARTTEAPRRPAAPPAGPAASSETAPAPDSATVPAPAPRPATDAARAPSPARLRKEQAILAEAESHFAQFGFEGASLDSIAAAAGISRHNLLYYFPNKEALYRRVLDDVLTQWLDGMEEMSHGEDPSEALRRYIRAKLRSSLERPNAAKVFAKEVIAGAPRYGDVIAERVGPVLRNDVRTFERWAREGRIARVNFTHLMFIIWSVTQAYADQQAQFALLLGKPALTERDYAHAEALICHMVLAGLAPDSAPPA